MSQPDGMIDKRSVTDAVSRREVIRSGVSAVIFSILTPTTGNAAEQAPPQQGRTNVPQHEQRRAPMYAFEEISGVHLEITSQCNISCPQCPRNLNGGAVNPSLSLTELHLGDIREILPASFVRQLRTLRMCGNYGDPIVARDTLEAFRYFRQCNHDIELKLHTNGSARSANWWGSLAEVIDTCVFGIDGLADTNHLYRRGANWHRVMASAQAFIAAGGRAEWAFLAFEHNEHQVENAERLSRDLGFSRFTVKKTSRFYHNGRLNTRYPVRNANGDIEYYLRPPSEARFQNDGVTQLVSITRRQSYADYQASTPISCKAATERSIYISAEGLVLPCCWLGALHARPGDDWNSDLNELISRLPEGMNSINAKLHPVAEIVAGPFFQTEIPGGWLENSSSRLRTCARSCGSYDILNSQQGV